jgi:hypothetical protein
MKDCENLAQVLRSRKMKIIFNKFSYFFVETTIFFGRGKYFISSNIPEGQANLNFDEIFFFTFKLILSRFDIEEFQQG